MEIKLKNTKVWTGTHRGVSFEINNFKRPDYFNEGEETDHWTYYLFLHLDRIPEENKPNSYWLKGKKDGKWIHYDYYKHGVINNIEFHGGCTWYSKERGFDGATKVIQIGCDYQHSWDKGYSYNIEMVTSDVENSIDKFLELVPDYKYWCCGNGKLYSLSEGQLNNDQFYSDEHLKTKEIK